MTDGADGRNVRQTAIGALVAGAVAVVVLSALASANVGSNLVQAIVAIGLGVLVAQLYERRVA